MPRFNLDDYVSVQERIVMFWRDHPNGRIVTELMSDPTDFQTCRYRASVYRDDADERPAAVGWAFEHAGGSGANSTSHEENCETSSIGRALANLGYATSQKDRPSREEMRKAERAKPEPEQQPTQAAAFETIDPASVRMCETPPADAREFWAWAREQGFSNVAHIAFFLGVPYEEASGTRLSELYRRIEAKATAAKTELDPWAGQVPL